MPRNSDITPQVPRASLDEHTYLLSHPRSGSHWFRYAYSYITRDDIYIGLRWPAGDLVGLEDIRMSDIQNLFSASIAHMQNHPLTEPVHIWLNPQGGLIHNVPTLTPGICKDLLVDPGIYFQPDQEPPYSAGYVLLLDGKIYQYDIEFMQNMANSRKKIFIARLNSGYGDQQGTLWLTEPSDSASSFGMKEILDWEPRQHKTHADRHTLTNYHWSDQIFHLPDGVIRTDRLPSHIKTENIKLLCLIRNYKECISSRLVQDKLQKTSELTIDSFLTDDYIPSYVKILQAYDEFPNQKKLIYYEDLINNPHETLNSAVINFARSGNDAYESEMRNNLESLVNNSQKHKHLSLQNYRKGAGLAQTAGKSTRHYSNLLNPETKSLLDKYMTENYPKLTEKYLQRYQEANKHVR